MGFLADEEVARLAGQARNLMVGERLQGIRYVIRDRDARYTGPFDKVFRTKDVDIVKTPIRAPRANAFAERWVRTVRTECLDWILALGRRHLEQVLRTYSAHYNRRRPHRGLDLKTPDLGPDPAPWPDGARVRTRDVLVGLSMNTISLLEVDREFVCPQARERSHEH
jgi:putative transposase